MLSITEFSKIAGKEPTGKRLDFNDFGEFITYLKSSAIATEDLISQCEGKTIRERNAKMYKMPAFSPVVFDKNYRKKENVKSGLSVCVFDFDEDITIEEAKAACTHNAVIATSARHTDGHNKFRMFVPFVGGTITQDDLSKGAIPRICEMIGIDPSKLDHACAKTAERAYIKPGTKAVWAEINGPVADISNLELYPIYPFNGKGVRIEDDVMVKLGAGISEKKAEAALVNTRPINKINGKMTKLTKSELKEVERALALIDPDLDRDSWVAIGMALRGMFDYSTGLNLFNNFSKGGASYSSRKELEKVWKSFSPNSSRTFKTILYYGKIYGWKPSQPQTTTTPTVMTEAEEMEYLCNVKSPQDFPQTKNEALCRYYSILDEGKDKAVFDAAMGTIESKNVIYAEQCKRFTYMNDDGEEKPWCVGHSDELRYIKLNQIVFDPTMTVKKPLLNMFRPFSIDTSNVTDEELKEATAKIEELILFLCDGDAKDADAIIKWCAYPFRHDFKKCKWTPIVRSRTQGTGKGAWFDTAMQAVYNYRFDQSNITAHKYSVKIEQNQLNSNFRGWMDNKLYIIGNEVYKGKYDVISESNNLKEIITGETLIIERKGLPAKEVKVHYQMVLLSNMDAPVALESGDRRFFPVGTDDIPLYAKAVEGNPLAWEKTDKLIEFYGYFFNVLKHRPDITYKYLMGIDVDESFGMTIPHKSKLKDEMISSNRLPSDEFFHDLKDGKLDDINLDMSVLPILPLKRLWAAWSHSSGYRNFKAKHLNQTFKSNGYTEKRVNVGGSKVSCFVFDTVGDVDIADLTVKICEMAQKYEEGKL